MSDFPPNTRQALVDTFLGSFVQSRCGEGGTLQTSNTGGARSASATLGLPQLLARGPPCPPCLDSRLLRWEPSEAGPGLPAPPRSKLLRFRHSGSPQRRRLSWAHILCPSQVRTAQVMRCLVSTVAVTYRFPHPCSSVFGFLGVQLAHLLRWMLTVQNPKKS